MLAGLAKTTSAWQSRGLPYEKIRLPTASNNNLSPKLKWYNQKIRAEFKSSSLKQDKVTESLN